MSLYRERKGVEGEREGGRERMGGGGGGGEGGERERERIQTIHVQCT